MAAVWRGPSEHAMLNADSRHVDCEASESSSDRGESASGVRICATADAPMRSPWSFASLIQPVLPATFFSRYWGDQPLHILRGMPDFYAGLITLAEVERYLSMRDVFNRHSITTPRQGKGVPDPPAT